MNKEEMIKEAYTLMVKNNPDEAIKNLIRLDKELDKKNKIVFKAINHIEQYCIDDEFYINLTKKEKNIFEVLNILKGEKIMNKYLITLNGCDDTTYCELELADEELNFLVKISKEINKYSSYQCQPSISIYKDYIDFDGKNRFITCRNYNIETDTYEWEATDLVKDNKKAGKDEN